VSVESANGVNMFAFSVDAPRVDVQAAQEVPAVREPVMTVERSSVVSGHGVTPEPAPAGR